uniref:Putative membrane-bound O-acyltransferase C24H6.01c n=1 Tax=Rhizophora mucronata TaxID=61149 RepID=A0A2P2Q2S0_RHIMU
MTHESPSPVNQTPELARTMVRLCCAFSLIMKNSRAQPVGVSQISHAKQIKFVGCLIHCFLFLQSSMWNISFVPT